MLHPCAHACAHLSAHPLNLCNTFLIYYQVEWVTVFLTKYFEVFLDDLYAVSGIRGSLLCLGRQYEVGTVQGSLLLIGWDSRKKMRGKRHDQ